MSEKPASFGPPESMGDLSIPPPANFIPDELGNEVQEVGQQTEAARQYGVVDESIPATNVVPSLEDDVEAAVAKAAVVATERVDGAIDQGQHERRASPLDELVNYFADKGNWLAPDPEKIRSAGFTIASYFDRIGHSGQADEGFEANIGRVVSAAAALMGRDTDLHKGHPDDNPLVRNAASIEFMARDIWLDAKVKRNENIASEVNWDKPKSMMDKVREYTRFALASKNPIMLQSYAELGSRTAKLIAAASEAGGQHKELDYIGIGNFDPMTKAYTSTKGYSDLVSKDYINKHLHRTLESVRSAGELVN